MKRIVTLNIILFICLIMQAQKDDVIVVSQKVKNQSFVLAKNMGPMVSKPMVTIDEKSKKSMTVWNRTEKDDWFEHSDLVVKNVPTIDNLEKMFPELSNRQTEEMPYMSMPWLIREENGETVLHCYFRMPADYVSNFWLTDEEGCILDKETGITYRARRTEPDCYYKRFGIKGKQGDVLDFKIFFPKLPDTTKDIAIYGVPNWQMRGINVRLRRPITAEELFKQRYDTIPEFHHPTLVAEAKNYDKDNFYTWSEYKDAHLIKPVKEGTMAMWLTPEATYLAMATELNWRREFFGRGGKTILIDNAGHQYKCKGVIDYPNDTLFWVQGMSGDYFAIVLVFEPLPHSLETITYIDPEGEPFKANFANWSGSVIPNLNIKELRNNQKLFEYFPRKIVE